jgi:T5SS/PEP-CTERM-associated repeat protein
MKRLRTNYDFTCLFASSIFIVVFFSLTGLASITTIGDVDPPYDDYDPWSIDGNLIVGVTSDANMIISDGSEVYNYYGFIGYAPGSNGAVTITEPNSLWDNSNYLYVGYSGDANMIISNGGHVISTNGYIGYDPNSSGITIVTGPNSLWYNSNHLYVGGSDSDAGGTGLLNISNSGTVEANDIIVWPTGTITGDGSIIGSVWSSGVIQPGCSIGILTIDGDLTMDTNSILEVEVDNSGNSDKLLVTGDVNIVGGTVKAISTETITGSRQYTILEANSVTGRFDSLDTALLHTSIFYPYTALSYGADSVILRISVVAQFDDPYICITDNKKALGKALQQIAQGGGNTITTKLQSWETIEQLRSSYDQLSGQTRPPLAPVTIADTTKFLAMPANRLGDLQNGLSGGKSFQQLFAMSKPDSFFGTTSTYDVSPPGYPFALGNGTTHLGDQKWGVWGKGYGLFGNRETENGVPGYQYTLYGASFGLDYQFTERLFLGITGGFSDGDVDYLLSRDTSDIRARHIGLYSTMDVDPWYLNSILTYSYLEYQTQRYVDLTDERLNGDFGGYAVTGYFEAGFNWLWPDNSLIRPSASFQISYLNLDGYTESGGSSSLTYNGQVYNSHKGSLGIRVTPNLYGSPQGRGAQIELRGRWVHEFGDAKSSVDARFASDPGAVFTVSDEEISRDSTVLGASLRAKLGRGGRLFFDYDVSLNADNVIHVAGAGLEYRW